MEKIFQMVKNPTKNALQNEKKMDRTCEVCIFREKNFPYFQFYEKTFEFPSQLKIHLRTHSNRI